MLQKITTFLLCIFLILSFSLIALAHPFILNISYDECSQEELVDGDDELAKALNMYRLTGESCVGEAAAFLDENASYIQRRMLNYVTRKIDSFNM